MTPALREAILRRDDYTCRACLRRTPGRVHAIIPRKLGGSDEPWNLVTLCVPCQMLASPIPVATLLRFFRTDEQELLVRKTQVAAALHRWVLLTGARSGKKPLEFVAKPRRKEPQPKVRTALRRKAVSDVPEWKRLRPRAGKTWTAEDDAELLRGYEAGLSVEQIALSLGRGVHAVEVRQFKLGVRLPR